LTEKFGTCCKELSSIMAGDEFDPLIGVRDNNILFMAVGFGIEDIETDDEALLTVDHPVFYCPFCGTKLQDPEAVAAQLSSAGESIQ